MSNFMESVSSIALAVIGLAVVAVIVSKKSNTIGVVQSAASGLANNIGVAVSPVTGASAAFHLEYPSGGSFGF